MKILIIRHGDPDYEHDSLTEKGRREAECLAKRLVNEKIDYYYLSPSAFLAFSVYSAVACALPRGER